MFKYSCKQVVSARITVCYAAPREDLYMSARKPCFSRASKAACVFMYCPFPYIFVGACIINGRGNMANMPDEML